MNPTKELEIGDIIEEFNCTGSSDRKTIRTYEIISVTKTLAKSHGERFKRTAELWNNNEQYHVSILDKNKWSVLAHRLQNKETC